MLKLTNVKKEYRLPGQIIKAVDGVSLEFRRNEFVSILGPSGCGKTTMMNIIGGLDQYTTGDLIIEGISTKDYKDGQWDNYRNKRVGFIFQSYNLISHLTVLGNVEMALTISGISLSERKQRAKEALIKVGLGDQLNKKPNQLSGGQMQRVAIARAIINEPEILLADEPTGALDTKTSEQIMDIIKNIAQDKLVIMVTHNPELAERYSTRLITMKDGLITSDSEPFDSAKEKDVPKEIEAELIKKSKDKSKGKTSMSFLTALGISQRNLRTKKKRSIMTSIASAIGILGIALILALSAGMTAYIDNLTKNEVESSPITVSAGSITQSENAIRQSLEKYPTVQKMFVEDTISRQSIPTKVPSDLKAYFEENLDEAWYNDVLYKTGIEVALYSQRANGEYGKISGGSGSSNHIMAMLGVVGSPLQQMLNEDFTADMYDILNTNGKIPTKNNEIALIVDEKNAITDVTLMTLGLKELTDNKTEYTFDEITALEFKVLTNNEMYEASGNGFINKSAVDFDSAMTVNITAVLRLKEGIDRGIYGAGIAYPKALSDWLEEQNAESDIAKWMKANPNKAPLYEKVDDKEYLAGSSYEDIITSSGFMGVSTNTKQDQWESTFRRLGGVSVNGTTIGGVTYAANEISIYAKNLAGKEEINKVLESYNIGKTDENKVYYVDLVELIGSMMTSVVNIISYVLIALVAISLVVSAVMISIITSISVLERTKEIGILRSIGARKKDVTRLFNAENVILGILSGIIGVVTALLLTIPINFIISTLAGVGSIAVVQWWHILLLLGISTGVAFISGFLPARKAAKKDPVLALRTE